MRGAVASLLLLLAPIAAAQEGEEAAARWIVPEARLSLKVPTGWAIEPGPGGREILVNRRPGVLFGENVNLNVRVVAAGRTVAQAVPQLRAKYTQGGLKVERAEALETSGGHPIAVLEVTRRLNGVPGNHMRQRQVAWYFNQGDRRIQVVMTLTAVAGVWKLAKPVFDAILTDMIVAPASLVRPTPAAQPAQAFPTVGISVTPPPGWAALPPDGVASVVRWVKTPPQFPRRSDTTLLSVEVRPIPGARAEAFVRDVAKSLKGKVSQGGKLGGKAAWIVRRATPPFEALFCAKNNLVYTVMLQGSDGSEADAKALAALSQGWTWQPLAAPSAHVALEARARPILNSFLIRLPAAGRPKPAGKSALQWVVNDHLRRDVEVLVSHELARIPNVAAGGLSTFRDRYGAIVTKRLGFESPPTWVRTQAKLESYRTQPLRFKKGDVHLSIVYGVFFANQNTAVAITITTHDPADAALKARYDRLAVEILDSVRLPRAVLVTPRER